MKTTSREPVTRRHLFLLGASTLALLTASGCKKGPPASCNDTTGLKPDEVAMRQSLEYVDKTPFPDKTCEKCLQWIAPASADQCGGCKVLKGPVHPAGYCKVFAPK